MTFISSFLNSVNTSFLSTYQKKKKKKNPLLSLTHILYFPNHKWLIEAMWSLNLWPFLPCDLISVETTSGVQGPVSWLRVKAAATSDSGNYSCSAAEADPTTVRIQVLEGRSGQVRSRGHEAGNMSRGLEVSKVESLGHEVSKSYKTSGKTVLSYHLKRSDVIKVTINIVIIRSTGE